jgi:DMSO reductase anchor subunit
VAARGGMDLLPEQGTRPVNKYLPPRPRGRLDAVDVLASCWPPWQKRPRAFSAGSTVHWTGSDMYPAPSVIAFTTLSVAGLGLLVWLGLGLPAATGLGGIGRVRAFAPPHTGDNYLLREFVFVVGRKHATKLRMIALALGYGLPLVLLALPFSHALAALAALRHLAGIAVSRWLFFAEAGHVVCLYHGAR